MNSPKRKILSLAGAQKPSGNLLQELRSVSSATSDAKSSRDSSKKLGDRQAERDLEEVKQGEFAGTISDSSNPKRAFAQRVI